MDDKKNPVGKGRGAFLMEMMRHSQQQTLHHSVETPSVSSSDQPRSYEEHSSQSLSSSSVSTGRGRAQLISLIRPTNESEVRNPQLSAGRGSILQSLTQSTAITRPNPFVSRGDNNGVLGKLSDLSVYDKPSTSDIMEDSSEDTAPICRQGKSGTKVDLYANYINLTLEPGKGLFQYEVKFTPDIDSRILRRKLLNQHSAKLGRTRTFDGMVLFLPQKLPENITCYQSEHPMDGSQVTLKIIFKKKQSMSENVQFFNVLLGRIMRALSLIRIGRQHFNPKDAHIVEQYRLEVWPGYVSAINEYEGGLKLCLDTRHRVMRTQTIRDLITEIFHRHQSNYQAIVVQEIVGTSVLTRYNNRTYRIDDIAWDKNPTFVFSRNGEETSLIEYYKVHWNIEIQDVKQPLLVHRATDRTPSGEKQERIILLVPELSYAAGLTDSMRANHRMMKDLDAVTKLTPNARRNEIMHFIKEVQKNPVTVEILAGWGLSLSNDMIQFSGRCLPPEEIKFGQDNIHKLKDKYTDWSGAAVRNPVLRTPNLHDWHVFCIKRDEVYVRSFISMLQNVVKAIGMQVNDPRVTVLRDDKTETFLREIQRIFTDTLELVTVVFPTNRNDRYSAIKKLCCVQRPIPSQVIIARTISNAAKLKSVTERIALQINCKLGGALWTVKLPLKNCMVCGIDVYHTGIGTSGKSVAGFVASLDAQLTKWHSRVCMQASKQELVDMLQMCLTSAIYAYHKHNRVNPDRIIIYRDGVGDGDLDYVAKYEVKQLLATLSRIESNYKPQISVIIVQKRIATRLFTRCRDGLENPVAGTVIDSCITRRNYYDFFLVPQSIRQGTVTPTHYIVIHDTSTMETDHMQRLTYKLCHLYYNWPGTIRIPAPCQYAHKLVYQVGQSIQAEPHQSLSNTLFYL